MRWTPLTVFILISASCAGDEDGAPDSADLPLCAYANGGCRSTQTECVSLTACLFSDAGWEASCQDGVVRIKDNNGVAYCDPRAEPAVQLCWEGNAGQPPQEALRCPAACGVDRMLLDTFEDYQAFEPASMCAS